MGSKPIMAKKSHRIGNAELGSTVTLFIIVAINKNILFANLRKKCSLTIDVTYNSKLP
jgi:hypothetical protein